MLKSQNDEIPLPLQKTSDRRSFGRRPVFKAATIAQGDSERLKVTVLDVSSAGARIRIANPEAVKKEFYLEIPDDDFVVKCRVRWLEDNEVGAEFIKAPRRLSWVNK